MKTRRLAALVSACALACVPTGRGGTLYTPASARAATAENTVASRVPVADSEASVPDDECAVEGWRATLETLLTAEGPELHGTIAPARPWDRVTAPRYIDRVERRFTLTADERDLLARNGFVVPERLAAQSYAYAYHLVHQAELPVYVSADSILHVVSALHEPFLAHMEGDVLAPMLADTLRRMHRALATSAREQPDDAALDADLVLSVARSLLERDEGTVPSTLGAQPAVDELTAVARAASPSTTRYLFGRPRVMNFSDYRPHGHYARDPALGRYYRATLWLSQIEMNLVSRGSRSSHPGPTPDTRETPREALTALVLADVMDRAGVRDTLARLDQAWSLLYGRREDVSLQQMNAMRDIVRIRDLRAGDTWERFLSVARNQPHRGIRTHALPEGVVELPVVASVLGVRVRPGSNLPRDLVAPAVSRRMLPTAAEAAYALGVDRARAWLDLPVATRAALDAAVHHARDALPETVGGNDLVSNWFRAVMGAGVTHQGRGPSFMATTAFADLRMNNLLVGYGQFLRRDEPRSEQAFTAMGCRIPTGWVDPVPDTYGAVEMYAERALAVAQTLSDWNPDRTDAQRARDRDFTRALDHLSRVAHGLRVIATDELEGRVITELQSAFVAMVAEVSVGDSSGPPGYSGWYFSLFSSLEGALSGSDFAAEWGGAPSAREHAWIGASSPHLGLFVVDNGGMPYVAVGPVARAWEMSATRGTTADQTLARSRREGRSQWSSTWWLRQEPEPPLAVTALDASDDDPSARVLLVRGTHDLGRVTIELLDPHGAPIGAATHPVGAHPVRFVFPRMVSTRATEGRRRSQSRSPTYIDNTRVQAVPQTIRIRTATWWYERPTRFGEDLRFALGGMRPIDEDGNLLPENSAPEE